MLLTISYSDSVLLKLFTFLINTTNIEICNMYISSFSIFLVRTIIQTGQTNKHTNTYTSSFNNIEIEYIGGHLVYNLRLLRHQIPIYEINGL